MCLCSLVYGGGGRAVKSTLNLYITVLEESVKSDHTFNFFIEQIQVNLDIKK